MSQWFHMNTCTPWTSQPSTEPLEVKFFNTKTLELEKKTAIWMAKWDWRKDSYNYLTKEHEGGFTGKPQGWHIYEPRHICEWLLED